ncbi:putative Vegetative incompatibility protein HET-E-1 [Seiridium unicorne]|uniref:Vegetative incompatibility protein HET-E-1 n=1 Tax=Seiridium unicorne TaxID=138068 RepID=A0ABR2UKF3_9PEZI
MRLINVKTKNLEEFPGSHTPAYAILSHTWGPSNEEVSFSDIRRGIASKSGPGRIKFDGCCSLARENGLDYAWIDTCCIDKTNSTELGEAINSMFKWYSEAKICYAYLRDVDSDEDISSSQSTFRKSCWFSRGWTLQELIAPKVLRFYDATWKYLGTKRELASILESITSISRPFLLGMTNLCEASVAQRMSWAAKRKTTRKEDIAYCLLGIFDITMPMVYGEGDRAFLRLQEEILRHIQDDSILAWGFSLAKSSTAVPVNTWSRALATSPSDYATSSHIVPREQGGDASDAILISGGNLRIQRPVYTNQSGKTFIVLNCHQVDDSQQAIGIPVQSSSTKRQPDLYGRLVDGASILPRVVIEASPRLTWLKLNAGSTSTGADRRCGVYINNRHERQLKLTEVEPRAWTPDFVVVLNIGWKNSQPEATYHVVISSKDTSLEDVANYFHETAATVIESHSASNGLMGIRVYLTRKRIGTQAMFELGFDTVDSVECTINIKREIQELALGSQLMDYLLEGRKVCLATKAYDQSLRTEIEALDEPARRLAAVDAEIRKLQDDRSCLEDTSKELLNRVKNIQSISTEARVRQEELISSVAEIQRQLDYSTTKVRREGTPTAQRHVSLVKQLTPFSVPTGNKEIDLMPDEAQRLFLNSVFTGDRVLFHYLVGLGFDMEIKDLGNTSLLANAAFGGDERIVRTLLANGADDKVRDNRGNTVLHWAASGGHVPIIKLLYQQGAAIDAETNGGTSPLGAAAKHGHLGAIRFLLDMEANIESRNDKGHSPLAQAAMNGHLDAVRILVDRGADIEAKSNYGTPPLGQAAHNGYTEIVRLLLDKGANIESSDRNGLTPLGAAAFHGHEAIMELLLSRGANIEAKSNSHVLSPLGQAAYGGHESAFLLLLKRGANIEAKSTGGVSLLADMAYDNCCTAVGLLLDSGADIESTCDRGVSPLGYAAINSHEAMIRLLLDRGANSRLEGDKDVLASAGEKNRTIAKLLQDRVSPLALKK